jgi:hypothetical protein
MYRQIAETLASEFERNPIDYIAEADIQVKLIEQLRSRLSPAVATVDGTGLEGTSDNSFKCDYWQAVAQQLANTGEMDRVHAEVSVEQGERLDVAVFQSRLRNPIQWISNGSKRFSEEDLDCVYEVKFIKNKTSFPKQSGNHVNELVQNDLSLAEIEPILDFDENKLRADITELNRLDSVDRRFLLLFSNNNYLYHNPTSTECESYKYGELYEKMGKAARQWMKDQANDGVEILYTHPRGTTWITD